MADISPTITLITLNVNGLIILSKQRFSGWIKKTFFGYNSLLFIWDTY